MDKPRLTSSSVIDEPGRCPDVSYEDGALKWHGFRRRSERVPMLRRSKSPQLGPDTFDAGGTPTRVKSGGCSCRAAGGSARQHHKHLSCGGLAALLGFISAWTSRGTAH